MSSWTPSSLGQPARAAGMAQYDGATRAGLRHADGLRGAGRTDDAMSVLVGVVEGDTSSRALLAPRPDACYVFIEPSIEPPSEAFDADAILMWNPRSRVLRENWSRFGRLRWVHTGSAGVERVLFPKLAASDVVLTNSRYVFDQALAEYTIALMLALSKDLLTTFRYQNEHRWAPRETPTLSGKVAVMVGVGPIARRTAQLAKSLGMSVRGIGRTARGGDPDFGDIVGSNDLQTLFADADYVVMV